MKSQNQIKIGNTLKFTQISASMDNKLGGPVHVVNQVSRLIHENCDYELIVFGTSPTSIQKHVSIPTFRNNRYGFFWGKLNTHICTQIRTSDVLLIHGFYLYSTAITLLLAKNCRIFVMPHGSLEQYQNKTGRIRKTIFDNFFRILALSRNVAFVVGSSDEILGVRDKFKKYPIYVLGLGVDEVPEKYIRKNGLQKPIRLLSFSRIAQKKRVDLSIEALKRLREEGVDARLTIAGTGSDQLVKQLRNLVKLYQLESFVDFTGFIDGEDKNYIFMNSDIFLLPSENENFAVAVAEAIARQLPVIVSNRVAIHRFVESHRTGVVIENLEVNSIVKAIIEVISNHDFYWQACRESRHLLFWENVFSEWKRILLAPKDARK